MTIINNIDCGIHPTWAAPIQTFAGPSGGVEIGSEIVEGGQTVSYSRSGTMRKRTETIWIKPPNTIAEGTDAAVSAALALYRQLYELFNSPRLHPVFIQWRSGGGVIVPDSEDGWYTPDSIKPDMEFVFTGIIPVQITVTYKYPGPPEKPVAMAYTGASIAVGYTGEATNWVSMPLNSSYFFYNIPRFGGEGYIPVQYNMFPTMTPPSNFQASASISDFFKGRSVIYDTINTTSNPVPGVAGTYLSPNWVQVMGVDHNFTGDCVLTNGLILFLIQPNSNSATLITVYYWNITTNTWSTAGTIQGQATDGNALKIRGISFKKVSWEDVSVSLYSSSDSGYWTYVFVRMIAGSYFARIAVRPKPVFQGNSRTLFFAHNSTPKISYNSGAAKDNTLAADQVSMPVHPVWGDSAVFRNNSDSPFIAGWLYADSTDLVAQGNVYSGGLNLGDSTPVLASIRYYGFYVTPFPLTQNLQSESETGTLGTGWTSTADALASAGLTAQCASGTLSGNRDIWGTSWVPHAGTWDGWFRIRVTSAAGSTPEMTFGLWDDDANAGAGGFVVGASVTYAANRISTSYTWIRSTFSPVTPPPGHRIRFRAVTAATLGTNWFFDESVMVPVTSNIGIGGPRDLWCEFAFDKDAKVVAI
jgi:hypothetical protein